MNNYDFISKTSTFVEHNNSFIPKTLKGIDKLFEIRELDGDYFYETSYPYIQFRPRENEKTIINYHETICKNPMEPWETEVKNLTFQNYKSNMENVSYLERDTFYRSNKFISPLIEKIIKRQEKGSYISYNIYYEEIEDMPELTYDEDNPPQEKIYCFATETIKYFSNYEENRQVIYKVHINLLTQEIKWYRKISQDNPEEAEPIQTYEFD